MSPNDKAAATYGPGRTTPPLEAPDLSEIRDAWVDFNLNPLPRSVGVPQVPAMQAEFNRAMDAVRAEALREAVSDFQHSVGVGEFDEQTRRDGNRHAHIDEAWEYQSPYMDWLLNRADELEAS